MKYKITGKKPEENRPDHSLNTITDIIEASDREKAYDIYRSRYKGYIIISAESWA